MNTYTVETPTLGTLADAYALHPDRTQAEQQLAALRERVAGGRAAPEHFLILRSERGVEGVAWLPTAPRVPVFPRLRPDAPADALTVLARRLRERVEPERVLVLQDDQAPLNRGAVEAAGWRYDSTEVVYETDLRARSYAPVPRVVEGGEDLWHRPDIAALLTALGRPGEEGRGDWTLVALPDADGRPVALGAYGPGGRSDWASLDMIGVHPGARGQGYGSRLHAHLLARAAERFRMHGGLTSVDNHLMRRIFEKNASRHVATQMYFRPG